MKKLFANPYFNIFLIMAIGVFVVYLSFSGQDPEAIYNLIKGSNKIYLLVAFLMIIICQYLVGLNLTFLARTIKKDYKPSEGFINGFIAALFHGITPSSTGGQIIQFYVFSRQGIKSGDAGSVLWMDFIIYQSCLTLVSLILIILKFPYFYANYSNLFIFVIIGFVINASIIFFIYALAKFERLHHFITTHGVNVAYRFKLIKNKQEAVEKLELQLAKFRLESQKLSKNTKTIFMCIFVSVLRLLIYYAIPFVIFVALGSPFSLSLLFDSIAMGSFVAIVSGMIPIPGASGGTEAIFVLMFGNIFLTTMTTGAMLIWRLFTYYLVMLIGAICLGVFRLRKA